MWEAIIDQMKEWVEDQGYLQTSFVDRGDPAAPDFNIFSFTRDGAWHDLDLSAIVPAGATAVLFNLVITNAAIGKHALFRTDGNIRPASVSAIRPQVANIANQLDLVCPLGDSRIIEYLFTPPGWGTTDFTVKGWWL